MIISEDENRSPHQIKAYRLGAVTVDDKEYHSSIIVSPNKIISDWPVRSIEEISDQHLQTILDCKPDIVLFGVGDQFFMPDKMSFALLYQYKIGVEFMDNAAACRTYIALSSEGRNVLVVLLIW